MDTGKTNHTDSTVRAHIINGRSMGTFWWTLCPTVQIEEGPKVKHKVSKKGNMNGGGGGGFK